MLCGCAHAIFLNNTVHCIVRFRLRTLYKSRQVYIPSVYSLHFLFIEDQRAGVSYAVYMGQSVVCVVVIFFIISYCSWVVGICEQHSQLILANNAQQQQRQKHNISDVLARTGKSTAQHSTALVWWSNRIESNQIMHCYE